MNKFYVIGEKSSKSLSPHIFNYWFKKYKIKATYDFVEIQSNDFNKSIKKILEDKKTKGINITIPFKKKIIQHIDNLDKHALKINAVNCVTNKYKKNGTNTDWVGYGNSLPKITNLKEKNVLILGYGGAAHAIHYYFYLKKVKNITIVNRSKKKIKFKNNICFTKNISDIEKFLIEADIIINTTPINPISKKVAKLVKPRAIISDIVYRPKNTKFLNMFPKNKKLFGITMLINQAIPSFNNWFGFNPSVDKKLLNILFSKIK
tara:strand:+ start:126 stop:911 length:786 start_codon:yes stop_codon:yes gene_type:complete